MLTINESYVIEVHNDQEEGKRLKKISFRKFLTFLPPNRRRFHSSTIDPQDSCHNPASLR